MWNYSPHFENIVHEIDQLMISFPHEKKDIGYGYRWTFTNNKHRFDCIDYVNHKCKWTTILRVGRGYLLVQRYPILAGLFDEVLWVIAKMDIPNIETLHAKHLIWLFEIMNNLKAWKYNQIME